MDQPPVSFRDRVAAWAPVIREYASIFIGTIGVLGQLIYYFASDERLFNNWAFALSVVLIGQPDKVAKAIVDAIAARFGGTKK